MPDVRLGTTTIRLVNRLAVRLDRFNKQHPWNHNDHYHRWLLRRLPASRGTALDVGCGHGGLVELLRSRARFARVVGIDPEPAMASASAAHFAEDTGVAIAERSFFDLKPGDGLVPDRGFDAVTMVASLHHLAHERDLDAAFTHARDLLAPGGRVLVIGLSRAAVPADYAVDGLSALLNPVVGFLKHPRRAPGPEIEQVFFGIGPGGGARMPVRDPEETFDDVVRAARRVLPGARVRRRLFFRYTLEWTAP